MGDHEKTQRVRHQMISRKNTVFTDFQNGEGILINKPSSWSSFDVVNKIRWMIVKKKNIKSLKVGHAGTLDPLATGVIIICTGNMTKQIHVFQSQVKEYLAWIRLGATTPSFDEETPIDQHYPFDHITPELFDHTLRKFSGEQDQIPPSFSAKYVNGKRAYKIARKGREVILEPKKIMIHAIEIKEIQFPLVQLQVICSQGTYIRSLARDIGTSLQSGAYLASLQRTRIGEYAIEDSLSIEEFNDIVH